VNTPLLLQKMYVCALATLSAAASIKSILVCGKCTKKGCAHTYLINGV
jgi:hypothetical protein